jgi:hypothetical protein
MNENDKPTSVGVWLGIVIVFIGAGFYIVSVIKKDFLDPKTSITKWQFSKEKQVEQEHIAPTVDYGNTRRYSIYSGNCIRYKKNIVNGNKLKYTPIDQGFGKLVLSTDKKSFNFYYNDNEIFVRNDYDSYFDDKGGQGFTSYNSAEAHRYIAERKLDVEFNGYRFEIEHYKEN